MPKHTISTRLIALMNTVGWEDRHDWNSVNVGHDLLLFREWLECMLLYLPVDISDLMAGYYFREETGAAGEGYYINLGHGRTALTTLYSYIQKANVS